jgi:large subunit ribosomal protein L13
MKTYSPKPRDIERRWYVLDASGAVLGRLATHAAAILRGKHKPIFSPHMDTGDHVIVVNAKEVTLSGDKERTKVAYRHSGYPGGLTATSYGRLLAEKPAFAVEKAIKGMLPHNRLGRQVVGKLRVYAGPDHRHSAQQPQVLQLGEFPVWDGLPDSDVPDSTAKAAAPSPGRPASKAPASRPPAKAASSESDAAKATTRSPAKRVSTSTSTAKRTTAKRATSKTTTKATTKRASKATSTKSSAAKSARSPARRTKKES